jgi:hypothetical protein
MLILGYCFGIRSERRLCEEVHLNLAYRWFLWAGVGVKSVLLVTAVRRWSAWGGSGFFACSAPDGAG